MSNEVALREYLEQQIAALTEMAKARFAAIDEARVLQAKEYERRLEALNHEHKRVADIQNQSVTKEKFEDYAKQMQTALDVALLRANEKIDVLARQQSGTTERRKGGSDVWGILAGVAGLLVAATGVAIMVLK